MGVTLGELEKLIFLNKTKIYLSFRVTWCFFNVPVQELQTSRVATPQKELIYTLIHGRDPIPCRTTYIEYKSQGEDSLFFIGTPPNSIGFHCKVGFFHCSTAPVVGVTLDELEKLIFLNTIQKEIDHFGGHRKLYFLTPTVKDHENQEKVHQFFVEYNLIPLVFIAKYFFLS